MSFLCSALGVSIWVLPRQITKRCIMEIIRLSAIRLTINSIAKLSNTPHTYITFWITENEVIFRSGHIQTKVTFKTKRPDYSALQIYKRSPLIANVVSTFLAYVWSVLFSALSAFLIYPLWICFNKFLISTFRLL